MKTILPTIHVSCGDFNGICPYLILLNHSTISKFCIPIYHCDKKVLQVASKLLGIPISTDFVFLELNQNLTLKPREIDKSSGEYSYLSFVSSIDAVLKNSNSSLVNLPISKLAWQLAGYNYLGHSDYFRKKMNYSPQMMLGGKNHFVILFTDHIPISEVPKSINLIKLKNFLIKLADNLSGKNISVLGLNPHAGEGGVIGKEDIIIKKAILKANSFLKKNLFFGPYPSDSYFSNLLSFVEGSYTLAMYHDQGLIGIKTLLFKPAIQVSLNLPFIRTTMDHGPAFDLAYLNNNKIFSDSYINAFKYAAKILKY